MSQVVTILAASKPTKPLAPTTTWLNSNSSVTVSWSLPSENGAQISAYTI